MHYINYQFISRNVEETEALAARMAALAPGGTVITLDGDLGVGKTAFARGFAKGLGIPVNQVSSPTFTIKHEYFSTERKLKLNHFDVYRLTNAAEFLRGGFQESFSADAVTLIEWSELIREVIPSGAWHIRFTRLENETQKDINWFDFSTFDLTLQLSSERLLSFTIPSAAALSLSRLFHEMNFILQGER